MKLDELSDDDLLLRTEAVHLEGQRVLARLLVHLVEIENRRLELRRAYSSLFDFCCRKLRMSDSEAYRRITAARLVRRFPALVGHVERGEIHLSILVLLKPHLSRENFDELIAASCGKTKREVQTLLACRAPKPDTDMPDVIQPLPTGAPQPALAFAPETASAPPAPPPPRIEPVSPQRHLVQFTVSTETRDKLERARDLLRHANPSGDLGVVIDRALTLLIAKLEKEKLRKTATPKWKPPSAERTKSEQATTEKAKRTRYIPADVARAVWERDGQRCAYVGPTGERCPATTLLELEHRHPFAVGGEHTIENVCVLCRAHNQWFRELRFGMGFPRTTRPKLEALAPERVTPPPPAAPPVVIADTSVDSHRLPPNERAQAFRSLAEMGFSPRDIGRALDAIDREHVADRPPPLVEVLREAIRFLTS